MLTLDPTVVADRIRIAMPVFRLVGLARDFGAVRSNTLVFPTAWVILTGESAGEAKYATGDVIDQKITSRIGIIMAVRDITDRTGTQAGEGLRPLRESLLLTLGRFVPEGADEAFRFARGALQSGIAADGALFWQDDFTLRHDRRIQIT